MVSLIQPNSQPADTGPSYGHANSVYNSIISYHMAESKVYMTIGRKEGNFREHCDLTIIVDQEKRMSHLEITRKVVSGHSLFYSFCEENI